MAEVKWIKLMTDMFDNRKIKYLRKLPEGNNIVLIWVMLLTMAGRCNAGGMIFLTENIPYDLNMLAAELDFDVNTVKLALESLNKLGMIVCDENEFSIVGWEEHQNIEGLEKIREQTRKRVAEYRDKQKLIGNVTRNVTVTQSNATEEEGEEDKDKEKECNRLLCSELAASEQEKWQTVFQIILNDKTYFDVHQQDIDEWQKLYPAVDVPQEIRNMIGWSDSNPKKRKTRSGIRRFINAWLAKEQNKPHIDQKKPIRVGMGTPEERRAAHPFTPSEL